MNQLTIYQYICDKINKTFDKKLFPEGVVRVGRQRHPNGYVGNLFKVNNPYTIRVGNSFFEGRIRKGDMILCVGHSGDCFQTYMFIEDRGNGIKAHRHYKFGSYGAGDSTRIEIEPETFQALIIGEFVDESKAWPNQI